MEWPRTWYLILGCLELGFLPLWALAELTLEDGSAYISESGAVLHFFAGVFLLALYWSPRMRRVRDSLQVSRLVNGAIFVFGTVLVLFASVLVYDMVFVDTAEPVEYYIASVWWATIYGLAGGSFVYTTGKRLLGSQPATAG